MIEDVLQRRRKVNVKFNKSVPFFITRKPISKNDDIG